MARRYGQATESDDVGPRLILVQSFFEELRQVVPD